MAHLLKDKAITLRLDGKTYREILKEVPVAKSTLSLWLRSVGLSIPQKQRITELRRSAALRGARRKTQNRLREIEQCTKEGMDAVQALTERELWLIGTALYWAEGSKQNSRSKSTGVIFTNTDPRMIRVYLAWLQRLGIATDSIQTSLYVHRDRESDAPAFREWWSAQIGTLPVHNVYFKRGNSATRRQNVGDLYHGILRITVKSSTLLNRQIEGWVSGIVAAVGSGVIGNTSAFEAEDSRIVP